MVQQIASGNMKNVYISGCLHTATQHHNMCCVAAVRAASEGWQKHTYPMLHTPL